MYELFYTWH